MEQPSRVSCGGVRGNELSESRRELVAHAAERRESFIIRAGGVSGVPDAPVNAVRRAGKNWAFFRGRIADGDDRVEMLAREFRNRFGTMRGNVDANFVHGFDRQFTDVSVGLAASTVHLVGVTAELAQQPFGHLAAHAIARAEDKNPMEHSLLNMMPGSSATRRMIGPVRLTHSKWVRSRQTLP